jgi:Flp pilus assembly protein TadD
MAFRYRGALLASLSVLALAACSSTGGGNMTNKSDAARVESILARAARDAKAAGNKGEALVLLEQLYNRNPEDAAIATAFGQSLREDEQLNRARQVLTPFTGSKPYPDAVVELAMVQLALGQYQEAELTARRAVSLDPKSGRAFLALGTALDAENRHEDAETAFREGLDKWQGDPAPILNNLALNLASQNKLDQALDMLRKAKQISPGRVEIERNMRIISTLKESADEFLIKEEQEKKQAAAPKQPVVPAVKKEAAAPAPTAQQKSVSSSDAEKPAAEKKAPPAKAEAKPAFAAPKTIVKKQAPEKVEPAAEEKKNSRGSTQNFRSSND